MVLPSYVRPASAVLERLACARESGDPAEVRLCEDAVVRQFRPMADRIAHRYHGRGIEDDDLIQLARLGLWKAIRRWSPQLDPTLVQFAAPTIEGEIKRYFRDHCRPIRMPRSLQEDRAVHQLTHDELVQKLGREPAEHELAAAAGSSVVRLRRQRLATRVCQPVSTDAESGSLAAGIRCEASSRALERVDDALALSAAIRALPERDQWVLRWRFLSEMSQSEIAAKLGVSQMQVSRLLRSILGRLRGQMVA